MDTVTARRMWRLLEPLHAVVYFEPDAREIYRDAGLKGGWMGYFASRAAAMGPVSPEIVTATFFSFAPAMVARAIPDAWSFSSPERVLAARRRVAVAALDRFFSPEESDYVTEAARLLRRAADGCRWAGRPLGAAHAALPWPDTAALALWHGATVLREHRGDGHIAALVAAGHDGCEALVLQAATGRVPRETLQPNRGWTDDEWSGAEERLRSRGLIDDTGRATRAGVEGRAAIEDATDIAARAPWEVLGDDACVRLESLLEPLCRRITDAGGVPFPNPIGLPAPSS